MLPSDLPSEWLGVCLCTRALVCNAGVMIPIWANEGLRPALPPIDPSPDAEPAAPEPAADAAPPADAAAPAAADATADAAVGGATGAVGPAGCSAWVRLIEDCWQTDPSARPKIGAIVQHRCAELER